MAWSPLVALAAAATWGGGDFSGGMGVKAAGGGTRAALRLVLLGHGISFLSLVAIALARGDRWPHGAAMWWGLGGGIAGGSALAAFYIALSRGAMGASAAVSGLLAAAVPAVLSTIVEGRPTALRLAGFAVAFLAIWLIAAADTSAAAGSISRGTMAIAVSSGVGFGIFFVALKFASPLGLVEPLALGRLGSLAVCGLLLATIGRRRPQSPVTTERGQAFKRTVLAWAIGVAVLDTGGNLLFLLATKMGRLDVAAVLSSLYPASTIALAAWLLQERPTRRQWAGMGVALVAVVMITA